MKNDKRQWILPIVYILLGGGLLTAALFDRVDAYWSGMGGGLLAVGILRLVRTIRYATNAEYREATDVANTDERNRFISTKAWSWTGYLFIILAGVGTIVCKLLNQEIWMMACAYAVCLLLVLYWICYLIIRKKY